MSVHMSKYFNIERGVLSFRRGHEIIRIEGWGNDALRVRITENKKPTNKPRCMSQIFPYLLFSFRTSLNI